MKGIWIPLITPFYNNEVDYESLKHLIEHYINQCITGIIILGTTGEAPVINNYEFEKIIDISAALINKRIPLLVGAGGSYTDEVINKIKTAEKYSPDGILSITPYFNKPDQNGIYAHFQKISESTSLKIMLYNNPARTGVNLINDTALKLSELSNIIGIKDCSGNILQTQELIFNKNKNFSVLCGDDSLFFETLALGADGGILASAHINTKSFIDIYNSASADNFLNALSVWKDVFKIVKLLFEEPNPAPLKYALKKLNLIRSDETRLPLTEISFELKNKLNGII